MKKKTLFGFLLASVFIPMAGFGQQLSSGIIDYTVTMERRSFNNPNSDQQDHAPREFTMTRQLTFNRNQGKFAAQENGNQNRRGGFGKEFINFNNKEYLRAFKRKGNDTTFYIQQPFKEAEGFKLSGKTRKIAGYNSQEATANLRNGKVTFWFTRDLPFTFSPLNGLIPPDGGVVLEIQNSRMHYLATKVESKDVEPASVTLSEPSKQVSMEELRGSFRGGNRGRRPMRNSNH